MRRTKKIRASKDEQLQKDTLPLTQRPEFIIGMTFLAVLAAVIISVLIFRFIQRRRECELKWDALVQKMESKDTELNEKSWVKARNRAKSLKEKIRWLQTHCNFNGEKYDKLFKYENKVHTLRIGGDGEG